LGKSCPRISEGYGDIGLIENLNHPFVTATKARHGIEGFYTRVWATMPVTRNDDSKGLLLFKLKLMGNESQCNIRDLIAAGNMVPLSGRTRITRKRILIPRWVDLGPWV